MSTPRAAAILAHHKTRSATGGPDAAVHHLVLTLGYSPKAAYQAVARLAGEGLTYGQIRTMPRADLEQLADETSWAD